MKRRKKWLALMMVLSMLLSMFPNVGTYATEYVPDTTIVSTESEGTEVGILEETTVEECTEENMEGVTEENTEEITEENIEVTVEENTEENTELFHEGEDISNERIEIPNCSTGCLLNGRAVYTNGNHVLQGTYELKPIKDNSILAKALYYSFGSLGYVNGYSEIDKVYASFDAQNKADKMKVTHEGLSDIYNHMDSELAKSFKNTVNGLPDYNRDEYVPYYILDDNHQIVGFTSKTTVSYETPDTLLLNAAEDETEEQNEEELMKQPGDQWVVVGVASPYIYVNGRKIVGSQYSVRKISTGEILGGWCYNHRATTAKVGYGLTEAAGTNKLVAISCLVAQGNGAMAAYYYGFNWQGYNPEVVATLANSILAGNNSMGSFGSVVDSYVNYIRSLDASFTLIHPYPSFTNNDSNVSYDNTSGLYFSKTMKLNVAEDSGNTLTWVSDDVLPDGVYAKVSDEDTVAINTSGCYTPGQAVKMQSNQYITYIFDSSRISSYAMGNYSQCFTMSQYVADSITFTPHGGYQPVIYASYNISSVSTQMGDVVRGRLCFQKRSGNFNITNGCNLYSVAGAEYVLKDENGNHASFIVASSDSGDVYRSTANAKLITNKDGWLTYKFSYSGSKSDITKLYKNVTGNNPYTITFDNQNKMNCDMGTYRLSETKASPGYTIDESCWNSLGKYHEVVIDRTNRVGNVVCRETPVFDPIQIKMVKQDQETGEVNPIGAGSLSKAVFEVDYYNGKYTKSNLPGKPTRKWYFATDESGIWNFTTTNPLNNSKYNSDEMYPNRQIPLGTVTIKEVTAPEGYVRTWDNSNGYITIDGNSYSDNKMVLYQIVMNEGNTAPQRLLDGKTVSSGNLLITLRAYDPVKRGNFSFDKREYDSGTKMPYIAFIMESTTTHEKHIIVTDENGHATTDISESSDNINGNDAYLDDLENPEVVNNKLRPTPVWFYGTADQTQWNPDNIDLSRGALPYDTYTITEIGSVNNYHTQLIQQGDYTFSIQADNDTVEMVLNDMELPNFETDSADKILGSTVTIADKNIEINDTITYHSFRFGESFTFKNVMVAREDCESDTGVKYKAGEPIRDDEGNYICANTTITTPDRNDSDVIATDGTAVITARFNGANLHGVKAVWKTYVSKGEDTDYIVIDENGVVNYEASNIMSFPSEKGCVYIESSSLDNEREWITFPGVEIHTTALSEDTADHIAGAYQTAKVIDTVEYFNLLQDHKYKLVGTAIDKNTGKPIQVNGKPLEVEKTFTPSSENMTEYGMCHGFVDVVFEFDASLLRGTTMVVYENLYHYDEETEEWSYVTKHEDINDEGQTVHFTDVRTTATDSNTNSHDSYAVREVTIIDKVFCSNLIKGRTYTVKGMIMVIPDEVDGADSELNDYTYTYDESTGTYTDQNGIECHPYLVDGKPVTAEKTFVAEQSGDCIVELAFTFDARPLKNRSINVFEDLYNENGIRIGTHADLTDEEQTIIFHPKDTSILVNTRNKIDGFGGVKTGDIPIIIFIILLLSSAIVAACIFVIRHKELMKGFAKKVKVTVSNHKIHMLLLLVMMTVSSGLIVATGVYAANNAVTVNEDVTVGDKVYDYQLITTYESDDPDMHYDFEKKHEGAKLVDTSYEVIDTVYPEKTVTTDKIYKALKDKDESRIADTITKDNIEYLIKDVTWEEIPVSEEVEYTMDFGYCTSEPSYPETYEYTYQSPTTGAEVTVSLPFVRLNQGQASWVDGFSADVTFKNLEGELFTLGNHTFAYNDNLSLTEGDYTELVKMLGYDTSLYRLTGFSWNGAVYETAEGELCRNGIATGQQYATRYSAYYADTVETGKTYNAKATYEAQVVDEAAAPTYTIQAEALYQNTGIWSNIISFVVNHKTVSGIFVFIIIALAVLTGIYLFTKKKPVEKTEE